jgi:hypothetical protein
MMIGRIRHTSAVFHHYIIEGSSRKDGNLPMLPVYGTMGRVIAFGFQGKLALVPEEPGCYLMTNAVDDIQSLTLEN